MSSAIRQSRHLLSVQDFCSDLVEYIHTKGTRALLCASSSHRPPSCRIAWGCLAIRHHPAAADPRLRWIFPIFNLFSGWVLLYNHGLSWEIWCVSHLRQVAFRDCRGVCRAPVGILSSVPGGSWSRPYPLVFKVEWILRKPPFLPRPWLLPYRE